MSVDLPVSRNTSDVADLLLRLPALPVFDNFRAVMKRIWKLWMPKQALNVHQQLEAGARYLDVRLSKFNHTLYGDHGLYTKQVCLHVHWYQRIKGNNCAVIRVY